MSIICLDTQILYWALVQRSVPGSENLIQPARDFIDWLERQKPKPTIIIPTIVVGEILIPLPDAEKPEILAKFSEDWTIVEYDLKAAVHFARLRGTDVAKRRIQERRELHPDATKKELVADLMIIATAIAHDADIIYSHNKDLREMAKGHIRAKNFLDEEFQMSLPENNDE